MTSRFQTKRTVLGDFAEGLVFDFLRSMGKVEMAEDPYDDEKDMIFDGKYNVEVKARSVIFKTPIINTFAIEASQWRKLDNSKTQTFFVNIPMHKDESIHLYFLKDRSAYTVSNFPNKTEKHRFYHIKDMACVNTITDANTIGKFYDLNFSKYKDE